MVIEKIKSADATLDLNTLLSESVQKKLSSY